MSAFGLSNAIITILSFNYGMKDKKRSQDCIKYGITDTLIVMAVITVVFEIIARPLAQLFALSGGASTALISVCEKATRIGAISFVFMGYIVAIQGVLQALGYATKPLILSLLRLVVFVFPVAYLFTLSNNVINIVWWTFLIAEVLTSVFAFIFLKYAEKNTIDTISVEESVNNKNLIITISRQHGTNGKHIGEMLAKKLNINFYDKQSSMLEAKKRGLNKAYVNESEDNDYDLYLSLDAQKDSIIAQNEIIKSLANDDNNSFVIVGRCADYVLRNYSNVVKIFLYAPMEYRTNNIVNNYGDSIEEAKKHILSSDKARANYYEIITNNKWGDENNFDLSIDCSIGNEKVVEAICDYLKSNKKI